MYQLPIQDVQLYCWTCFFFNTKFNLLSYTVWRYPLQSSFLPHSKLSVYSRQPGGFFFCAELQSLPPHRPVAHLIRQNKKDYYITYTLANFNDCLFTGSPWLVEQKVNQLLERRICICTCAICVIVLVYKDMVQDEREQFRLQRVLWGIDQGLQVFPASRHHLVAEDEQEITQDGKCLWEERKKDKKLKVTLHKHNTKPLLANEVVI